ncbi:MAG TPA: DUF1059 domain-containing protein [Thermoleophilaceae bacterium]|nr:DUF1059 domain-containing protein [Thermoleophilaceae bacterium]
MPTAGASRASPTAASPSSGDENEVLQAAAEHSRSVHGHQDSVEELREQMRPMLEPEESYVMGSRAQEPFPA